MSTTSPYQPVRTFWISRILFIGGALLFLVGLAFPWAGLHVRNYRHQIIETIDFPFWDASEEATAAVVLVAIAIAMAGLTFRNRSSWPYLLSGFLESGVLIAILILIFLHSSESFHFFSRHHDRTFEGHRVPGPYFGLAAALIMLLGSSLKLIHALRDRSR